MCLHYIVPSLQPIPLAYDILDCTISIAFASVVSIAFGYVLDYFHHCDHCVHQKQKVSTERLDYDTIIIGYYSKQPSTFSK